MRSPLRMGCNFYLCKTLKYYEIHVLHGNTMTVSISLRISEQLFSELENLAQLTDRSKSYLIKKAIEHYLQEYADYRIALDRFHDTDDKVLSSKQMRKLLGN